jgi:hypothetical protein
MVPAATPKICDREGRSDCSRGSPKPTSWEAAARLKSPRTPLPRRIRTPAVTIITIITQVIAAYLNKEDFIKGA